MNFSLSVSAASSNLSLVISNNATAWSYLLLKKGGTPTDTDFDYISRLKGATNVLNLQPPEFEPLPYGLRVLTPAASATQAFRVLFTTNRTDLRSGAYPVLKPVVFSTTGVLTNTPTTGTWNYFQVDVPTNLPGWRIVLSATGVGDPNLYVRRGRLPDTSGYDKASTGQVIDTVTFTDQEATNYTYYIGVHLPVAAAGPVTYTLTAEVGYLRDLAWDPGLTHEGTQIYTNRSPTGGNYFFRVLPQATSVGAWRTALNVQSGEAQVYLRKGGFAENSSSYTDARSERVGADGFVLHSSQFAAGQTWFLCVYATPGAEWTLVTGEAYVLNLGTVSPYWGEGSSTNVPMGAEGMRFFRATPPVATLAWRLYLNGATNDLLVKKIAVPHPLNTSTWDLKQPRQMLVVPTYLVGGDQYFIGVVDVPGALIRLDCRQQEILELPFVGSTTIVVTNYGYVTFRVNVPVQQIAWQITLTPTLGDANVCVRTNYVPNEWNNSAFSEVAAPVSDSLAMVPPTLSDGISFVTVYGLANYTVTLTSGNPVITDVAYVSTTVNDDPGRVGWRYYRVGDIASQLGSLGWDLFLQSQPPGTELALRRNAVPGRWNYRRDNYFDSVYSQGWVDYSGPQGFLQRPGHQADIWYIGAYNPSNALGNFVLNLRELIGPIIAYDGALTNVSAQPPGKFYYWRVDVPNDALGWDVRLTNVTSGDPRLVVRRDQLPDDLTTHGHPSGGWYYPWQDTDWPSGYQWAPSLDWTDYPNSASGASQSGRIFACGAGNPLKPGTYYVGVLNASGNSVAMSYTLLSRGIGASYTIPVTPLAFSNGVASIPNLAPREAAYFQVTVPTNRENWKLRLVADSGDSLLAVQKGYLPNIETGGSSPLYHYGGRKLQKAGNEEYLLLAMANQSNVVADTYYLAVVSEGQGPTSSRSGTGVSSATLNTFGTLMPTNLGTLTGPDLTSAGALAGGEAQTYRFTVPAGVLAMEVWLEPTAGYPRMCLRPDSLIASPLDSYGYDEGSGRTWSDDRLINVANPAVGDYTIVVQAAASGGVYSNANYTVRVHRLFAVPLAFDAGLTNVSAAGHLAGTWRYFTITVPPDALGWDVRLTNVASGDPELVIRRDLAPDGLTTRSYPGSGGWYYPWNDNQWRTGYQLAAGSDWTGIQLDANGTNRNGHIIALGMGNPLEPGSYYVGVRNSLTSSYGTNDMRYTLVSRGIGAGFSIPVLPLAFDGGTTNVTDLPPREVAYFSIEVLSNSPSWKLRVGTNVGEACLILQKTALPSVFAGANPPDSLYGGRRLQKAGPQHYLLLPDSGKSNIDAGTYYLGVVSEGVGPVPNSRLGSNSISATLQSYGPLVPNLLGMAMAGSDLVLPDTLEGGEIKAYQFDVAPGTLSLEVRLESRTASPRMTLRPDAQFPTLAISYGNDGGQTRTWLDPELIIVANPSNNTHTLLVQADYTGPTSGAFAVYSNATYTVRVHAVGAQMLRFDGGAITVTDHEPNTWRYFLLTNVPEDAAGWDVRLTNVTSGDPQLVVRRELLPDGLTTHTYPSGGGWYYPWNSSTWPVGYQWVATYDWTGYATDANGTNRSGHILQMGMGNPLEPGLYYVGVRNNLTSGYGTNTMRYTIASRGIGRKYSIPVRPLLFAGGSATNDWLPLRDLACYSVEVPSATPSWKVRLSVGVGESMVLVQKDAVPNVAGSSTVATSLGGGYQMQKVGNEQYALLPTSGQTTIPAGLYYLLVASEGMFPNLPVNNRAGTNGSSYLLQSQGSVPVEDLGPVPFLSVARTNSVEGGELRAYHFTLNQPFLGLEVRLENRVQNPYLTLRRGPDLPYPYYDYGYNGGFSYERQNARLITLANPEQTNFTVLVQGGNGGSGNVYPDADYVLRVGPAPITELAFDPTLEGCENRTKSENLRCTNACGSGLLADDERAFYRVQVPDLLPDGAPVLGWRLTVSNAFGAATVRVRKDLLPSDSYSGDGQTGWVSDMAVVVPTFLTPGTWYVEVRGSGSTSYRVCSSAVRLYRPTWVMPGVGEPITTPGLTAGPLFADSGVDPAGVALPTADGGIDLEQGFFHYYAVSVPVTNGGVFRMVLEAISGNPDLYIRAGALPTLTHRYDGRSGTWYDRSLTGTTTEYGNWVPDNSRYEKALTPGTWYIAIRATGSSNCRYRLKMSTGWVTDLQLGESIANHNMAGGDWRYYRFYLPTNAPSPWSFSFQQHVGDVVVYVRDTVPPGQFASVTDYRHWATDNKNHASYPTYDPPASYTNRIPPLRPGHFYYLGFRAVSDATFSLGSSTNSQTIGDWPVLAFYGGQVTNFMAPGEKLRYRIDVPDDATRWISVSIHSNSVRWYLEQGSLPTETSADHSYSGGNANVGLNRYLLTPNNWPWVPSQMYFLVVSNSSTVAQPFFWRMDGRNCVSDDSDADGLPDCWELAYWPYTSSYNGTSDPDNDGNNNLTEYLDGTDPTDPTSLYARLTLQTTGPGTATAAPVLAKYFYGTPVTLTAVPDPGQVFYGWAGAGISGSANPLTVLMTTNRTVLAAFGPDYGGCGTLRADYRLQNEWGSAVGTPPPLTNLNGGLYFTNQSVDGAAQMTLRFPQGSGVILSNATSVIPSNTYTLVMLFKLDTVTSYRRIFDLKNATVDRGLYVCNGRLNHYNATGNGALVCMAPQTWHQVVLTRDLAGQVVAYCDGVPQVSFNDTAGDAIVSGGRTVRFCKDDGGEESGGSIARLRLYTCALSAAEVAALDRTGVPIVLSDFGFDVFGGFYFRISGPVLPLLRVERTEDLINWTGVQDYAPFGGTGWYTNPPVLPVHRFFRAVVP